MPSEQGRGQIARGLREQAVGVEHDGNLLAILLGQHFHVLVVERRGEEAGRRQLHLVADDDHLPRTAQRRHRVFGGYLAGLVEDDHVEQLRLKRQRVRDRKGAHQPDGLQIIDDAPTVAARHFADGLVAHRLAELVLQLAAAGGVDLLEGASFGVELGDRGFGQLHIVAELAVERRADGGGVLVAQQLARGAGTAREGNHAVDVEPADVGVGPLARGDGLVDHQRLDGSQRLRQGGEHARHAAVGAVDLGEERQQVGQIVERLAQIAQEFGQLVERQRVDPGKRAVQRLAKRTNGGSALPQPRKGKRAVAVLG